MSKKELKTLKQIEHPYCECGETEFYADWDLREEAKKWIEAMETQEKDMRENSLFYKNNRELEDFLDVEYSSFRYIKRWVKHFFNLGEE